MGASQSTPLPHSFDYGKKQGENVKKMTDEYEELFGDVNDVDECDQKIEVRKKNYETMVNSYYDMATDFYEYGWGQSFHFAPQTRGQSFDDAIKAHEHFLADKLKLAGTERVLDLGCGVGGPARVIARYSGCHITGLNNNDYQIERARMHVEREGLSDAIDFVKGDFMKLDQFLEASSFDAVYAIESTPHAPDKTACFREVLKVLKPGGYFTVYEWCMTDQYDPSDSVQRKIKRDIEEGDSLPTLVSTHAVEQSLKDAGFELIESKDLALTGDIPWYMSLNGSFFGAPRRSSRGRWLTHQFVRALETLHIAPPGATKISEVLCRAADSLVEGGKKGIFTPMFWCLARKPEGAAEAAGSA